MYSVDVRTLGEMPVPGPEVYWMSHWDTFETLWFLMVVARSQDGANTVVVNTGPPADLGPLNDLWRGFHPSGRVQYRRREDERPAAALASLGVAPEQVTHVVLTPLVAYTCANLDLFPNAEIVISRRGWIEDVYAPPYPPHVPRDIYLPPDVARYLVGPARDRLRLIDEGAVCPGVRVWWAGVHHRSSLAVVIETAGGPVIASDAFFKYGNVERNHYLGIGESYAEAMQTYRRVRDEAAIVLPLYDPEVFERFPAGKIA